MFYPHREQARSHSCYWSELTFYSRLKSSVGASLLAKSVYQSMQILAGMAPSRASPLPQSFIGVN
ncbi:hypothetical protein FHG55_28630 [Pseudomonas jessenii]|uniref:Uncharacterized protein n=1 Tax=Pseudomonas jessenii TaxID=77298 RepID=A0A5C4KP74_PSEJE|nr:hypothetical protein FHG55_28630 [Pseudomonas jessenii]